MTTGTRDQEPATAVARWWQSMQDKDLSTLSQLTLVDYLSAGGPGGRTEGRDGLLREAAEFFGGATIDSWSLSDMQTRLHGDVAVCSYRWAEQGTHQEAAFNLRGVATDVLVCGDGIWRHQAHHVSML